MRIENRTRIEENKCAKNKKYDCIKKCKKEMISTEIVLMIIYNITFLILIVYERGGKNFAIKSFPKFPSRK